jgi:hypothetical protein
MELSEAEKRCPNCKRRVAFYPKGRYIAIYIGGVASLVLVRLLLLWIL